MHDFMDHMKCMYIAYKVKVTRYISGVIMIHDSDPDDAFKVFGLHNSLYAIPVG